MPFGDESFDVVLSSGALHHISHNPTDHKKAIAEMIRVLKPGGNILLWDVSHMIEASASNMRPVGITCEVKGRPISRIRDEHALRQESSPTFTIVAFCT